MKINMNINPDKLKQIRIDLLTAADQTISDYNSGVAAAKNVQKKWPNDNIFQVTIDLKEHGYLEKTAVTGLGGFTLGSLTDSGRHYLKDLLGQVKPQITNNYKNNFAGNIQNIQEGNNNSISITVNENSFDYSKFALFLKTIESLKEDYQKEGGDSKFYDELKKVEDLNKEKAPTSKIKKTWEKAKAFLSSQATTNAISVISVIMNAVNFFK